MYLRQLAQLWQRDRASSISIQVKWASVQAVDIKFYQYLTHQKSLKSVNVSVLGTQCVYILLNTRSVATHFEQVRCDVKMCQRHLLLIYCTTGNGMLEFF